MKMRWLKEFYLFIHWENLCDVDSSEEV